MLNTETVGTGSPILAKLYYQDIRHLEGKILTIIDASIGEPKQNKAIKDLIRRAIWFDWVESLHRTDKSMASGMPDLDSSHSDRA